MLPIITLYLNWIGIAFFAKFGVNSGDMVTAGKLTNLQQELLKLYAQTC